jgi:Na+/proline symporter
VNLVDGLRIAGATGRLRTFDFSGDLTNQYTFWSGTIAAFFLFCSYFGTDQSQVQRFLTARSVHEARHSLLMSAYWKIPLQALVLMVGILIFVFYIFETPPLLFSTNAEQRVRRDAGPAYAALEREHEAAIATRRAAAGELTRAQAADDDAGVLAAQEAVRAGEAAVQGVRRKAQDLVRQTTGDGAFNDVNYIIPMFILRELPVGLVGLLILAILLAATDTIAGELNSLSTVTVIDFYRRFVKPIADDSHYLKVSMVATGVWGLFACAVAVWAADLGSLIEVVNRIGSFFYGSLLGVFMLAIAFPRATGHGAFVGLLAGMGSVAAAAAFTQVAFLWHNVIGAVVVVIAGLAVSMFQRVIGGADPTAPAS